MDCTREFTVIQGLLRPVKRKTMDNIYDIICPQFKHRVYFGSRPGLEVVEQKTLSTTIFHLKII